MVITTDFFSLFFASENDVNELTAGKASGPSYPWPGGGASPRIQRGQIGVLCKHNSYDPDRVKPVALIVEREDERRLFSRFSQLRSDLSPLSSWLHVFSPSQFQRLHEAIVDANLYNMEASWAGLIIAEAAILARRAPSQLKLMGCLATQSFAVGRATALWGFTGITPLLDSYDAVQKSVRANGPTYAKTRNAFEPIWVVLQSACGAPSKPTRDQEVLVSAIHGIKRAREIGESEISAVQSGLWLLPEAGVLSSFDTLSPELRLKEFDSLLVAIRQSHDEIGRRLHLSFLAAYVATIAAGGASSLTIAEAVADEFPEVLAFAYIIGGVGEIRSWAGGFDGLGRLVARELLRSVSLADGPVCDFSGDEAATLIDKQLSDPLIYLRLKQSRVATVALLPGVNIQVPFAELPEANRPRNVPPTRDNPPASDPLSILADALMPYLFDRLSAANRRPVSEQRSTSTKRSGQRKPPHE